MPSPKTINALPSWLFPTSIAIGVLLLALLGWKMLSGGEAEAAQSKNARPNTYDTIAK